MILVASPRYSASGVHVGVDAAEQEAAVALEGAELLQVVAAFAVEARRVAGVGALVLDLQQLAGVVEGPAVERAGEAGLVALLVAAQHRAAVRAGVGQRVELAVLAARDDDRLAADVDGEVVVDVRDLALVGQVDPVAFEDVLHLQFEQFGSVKAARLQAVDVLLFVFDQHAIKSILDAGSVRRGAHEKVSVLVSFAWNSCNDALTVHRPREKIMRFWHARRGGLETMPQGDQALASDHYSHCPHRRTGCSDSSPHGSIFLLLVSLSLRERTFGNCVNPGVAGRQRPEGNR